MWNASEILAFTRNLDPTRLVDFNSGGPGNSLHIGDVNDIHSYPYPDHPEPSATQYAEVGEYGGIGWRPSGKQWLEDSCGRRAIMANTSADGTIVFLAMIAQLITQRDQGTLSAAIITQITDVELECDGLLAYDRTPHFSVADTQKIAAAYRNLTRPYATYATSPLRMVDSGTPNAADIVDCASSDQHLAQLRQTICHSLVGPGTTWCDPEWKNITAKEDWPNQATYMQALLDSLVSKKTCLNTSYARDTVQWINVVQGGGTVSGSFMNTWIVFQVCIFDSLTAV